MKCRFCNNELDFEFIDLVNSPLSNSNLTTSEIFNEKYAYFSSFSKTWLEHAKNYVEIVIERFNLNKYSYVVEIGSNDGYLLQYFQKFNIPCLGIEPASNTAAVAKEKGIDVIEDYFGSSLAKKLASQNKKTDLLLGNNVLAHVPEINDFVQGLKILLSDNGVITMEFPHLMQLIENNQFDTIYHEHFSYYSFITVKSIFESHGIEIFDVDQIPTHGGSLRIYAKHEEDKTKKISSNVKNLTDLEISKKMNTIEYYKNFQDKANKIKYDLQQFLIKQKLNGKIVAAYGAAAKGNTLLNYCGIKKDLINFIADASPYKQGKYLPGSHIPIVNEKKIKEVKPDFVIILPWNIKDEIIKQLNYIKEWGSKFVIPIPEVTII